mmetsp:Transcript_60645/g.139999  ORF Transcript_60645/g.139999 Transcript_60645/m.139999 type:complete len:377 (+) Transcript_60645:50-1180(+)
MVWIPSTFDDVKDRLSDPGAPIEQRYRSLFYVRQFMPTMADGVEALAVAVRKQRASSLLRHEACYVLGQIGDATAVGFLREVLHDEGEDEVVRHEAAEALAAIGAEGVHEDLSRYTIAECPHANLAGTCELALATLQNKPTDNLPPCACQYTTRDPAVGRPGATAEDIPQLGEELMQANQKLYERYVAMFSLRNLGGPAAAGALAKALVEDTTSAVLRHEVAFVLAQLEEECSVPTLAQCLANTGEDGMVRHEAAIALGTIGSAEAQAVLREWVGDEDVMVAESCQRWRWTQWPTGSTGRRWRPGWRPRSSRHFTRRALPASVVCLSHWSGQEWFRGVSRFCHRPQRDGTAHPSVARRTRRCAPASCQVALGTVAC